MQNFWIKSYLKHSPEINSVYAVYKQLCIQSLISLHNNCRFLCGSFKGNCDSNFFIKIKDRINLNFQDLIFTFQDLIISRLTISFLLVFKLLSSRKQKLITSTFQSINLVSFFLIFCSSSSNSSSSLSSSFYWCIYTASITMTFSSVFNDQF